ncbi:MAG: glucosyl-3-phosphoglycerate phosphatase [Actinomycetota bacterium]|jgi:broad specificity phosphatase PhoE|nr:glucosyl-3-phosphoglycerate phosphatase [Actinomycetota bacterium]
MDIELDAVGRAQAFRAARLLAGLSPSVIVSSDLMRARDTAQMLADVTDLPVRADKRLREIDVGSWQGLRFDEVLEKYPVEAEQWRDGGEGRRGGGETLVEVGERATAAVGEALGSVGAGETLVVVTHGAAGRALVASMIALPTTSWRALGSLANCCWSVLGETDGGWRLHEHNAGTLPEPVVGDDR